MSTATFRKTVSPVEKVGEPARWLNFFPRWSLIVGLATLTLPIVFLVGLGQQASDNALGMKFTELLQAVRSPVMFRLVWSIDAILWLMIGGSLLTIAGILRRHAPLLATFILIGGIAQLFGTLGSFLRLDGISALATIYRTATSDQQFVLRGSYLTLRQVINSSNQIGVLLQGVGFTLAAWGTLSLRGFPRWLAVWFAVPGLLAIAQFALFAAGAQFLPALNIIGIAGNIALNFAITVSLRRPSARLISSVSGEYEG